MKREVYSFISGLLLFSCLAISCDDGKIYDENNQTEREGGTVKLTAQINGIDSWPGGYSVVLAGFTPDNALRHQQATQKDCQFLYRRLHGTGGYHTAGCRKVGCRHVQQYPNRNFQSFLYGLPWRKYGTCCRTVPHGR